MEKMRCPRPDGKGAPDQMENQMEPDGKKPDGKSSEPNYTGKVDDLRSNSS
jgi:hypothetical protein